MVVSEKDWEVHVVHQILKGKYRGFGGGQRCQCTKCEELEDSEKRSGLNWSFTNIWEVITATKPS